MRFGEFIGEGREEGLRIPGFFFVGEVVQIS